MKSQLKIACFSIATFNRNALLLCLVYETATAVCRPLSAVPNCNSQKSLLCRCTMPNSDAQTAPQPPKLTSSTSMQFFLMDEDSLGSGALVPFLFSWERRQKTQNLMYFAGEGGGVGARNRYNLSFWRFFPRFIALFGPIWGHPVARPVVVL